MPEISDEHRDATLANLRAMNAALEEEAQMRRDAERYRWLNLEATDLQWQRVAKCKEGAETDAYIDAQMAAGKEQ